MEKHTEILKKLFPGKVIKDLTLVDRNNKKSCTSFVEINLAPFQLLPESKLENTVFIIDWDDSKEKTVGQVMDILRLPLNQLSSLLTYPSHGMDALKFSEWWHERHGEELDQLVAIYIYVHQPLHSFLSDQ